MSADLTGLSSIDRPTGPLRPGSAGASVSLGRVAVRRPSAEPDAPASAATEPPLQGSGLDPRHVVGTTDTIANRLATGGVALEVGLEHARQALLRNRPGDSLAALDGIWDGAQQTEEGWYLRSGALAALGLPGESDRVAGDGLLVRPSSSALGFLQSLARMALGDFAGARASLQSAIARSPFEPVLLVQHALLQAKAGDPRSAEVALHRLWARAPDHPALTWGRAALAAMVADDARRQSRGWEVDDSHSVRAEAALQIFPDASPEPRTTATATPPDAATGAVAPTLSEPTDLASSALERFGARLAQPSVSMAETAQDARALLRAFSAGGSLANATTAEQAHAARVLLMSIAAHATGEATDAPPPLSRMIQQLVPMLTQRKFEDARLMVQRQRTMAREPVSRLLLAVIRGASLTSADGDGGAMRREPEMVQTAVQSPVQSLVQGDVDRGPLPAIRLGLSLVEESALSRAVDASLRLAPAANSHAMDRVVLTEPAAHHGALAERVGEGWGAGPQAAAQRFAHRDAAAASAGLVAIVGVLFAIGALVTGHGLVATLLAVGATWLGLRRPRAAHPHEGDGLHGALAHGDLAHGALAHRDVSAESVTPHTREA